MNLEQLEKAQNILSFHAVGGLGKQSFDNDALADAANKNGMQLFHTSGIAEQLQKEGITLEGLRKAVEGSGVLFWHTNSGSRFNPGVEGQIKYMDDAWLYPADKAPPPESGMLIDLNVLKKEIEAKQAKPHSGAGVARGV